MKGEKLKRFLNKDVEVTKRDGTKYTGEVVEVVEESLVLCSSDSSEGVISTEVIEVVESI